MNKRIITSQSFSIYKKKLDRAYLNILGHRNYRRFAVIGYSQPGSNYLFVGLNSSSCVRMYYEIFAKRNRVLVGKDFDQIFPMVFQKESRNIKACRDRCGSALWSGIALLWIPQPWGGAYPDQQRPRILWQVDDASLPDQFGTQWYPAQKNEGGHPRTNGLVVRFNRTVLDEFLRKTFRKKFYGSLEDLRGDLDACVAN